MGKYCNAFQKQTMTLEKKDCELLFLAMRTDNYVRMACNAAMSFRKQGLQTTLVTEYDLYIRHKVIIDKYFDKLRFTHDHPDPGWHKVNIFDYACAENSLFIDADSLAALGCDLFPRMQDLSGCCDFWLSAYAVNEVNSKTWSHWGNFNVLYHEYGLSGRIANGTQSSCIYFKKHSETTKELQKNCNKVYDFVKSNQKSVQVNRWMKDFVPDELVWTVATNLTGLDPDLFTQVKVRIGFVEHKKNVIKEKQHYLNDFDIITFPCGKYRLSDAYKQFYNELSKYHAKRNGQNMIYKYVDKV